MYFSNSHHCPNPLKYWKKSTKSTIFDIKHVLWSLSTGNVCFLSIVHKLEIKLTFAIVPTYSLRQLSLWGSEYWANGYLKNLNLQWGSKYWISVLLHDWYSNGPLESPDNQCHEPQRRSEYWKSDTKDTHSPGPLNSTYGIRCHFYIALISTSALVTIPNTLSITVNSKYVCLKHYSQFEICLP